MAGARRARTEAHVDRGEYAKQLNEALEQFELDADSEILTILLIQLMQNNQITYEVEKVKALVFDERSQTVNMPNPKHSSLASLTKIYQYLQISEYQPTNKISIPVRHFLAEILPKLKQALSNKHEQALHELVPYQMQTRARHSEPAMRDLEALTEKICRQSSYHLAQYHSRLDGIFGQCSQLSLLLNELNCPNNMWSDQAELNTNEKLFFLFKKMSLIHQTLSSIRNTSSETDIVPKEILETVRAIEAKITLYTSLNKNVSVLAGNKCREEFIKLYKTNFISGEKAGAKALLQIANIDFTPRDCRVSQRWEDPSRLIFSYDGLSPTARDALREWLMKQGVKNIQVMCRKSEPGIDYSEQDDSTLGGGDDTPRTSRVTLTRAAITPIEQTYEFFMDGAEFSQLILHKILYDAKLREAKKLANSKAEIQPAIEVTPQSPSIIRIKELVDSSNNSSGSYGNSNAEETADSQSPRNADGDVTRNNIELDNETKIREAVEAWNASKNSNSSSNTPEMPIFPIQQSGASSPAKPNKKNEGSKRNSAALATGAFSIFKPYQSDKVTKAPSAPEMKRKAKTGSFKTKANFGGN